MGTSADNVHQELLLKNRSTLTLSGVLGVIDFDESTLTLSTNSGTVCIEGKDMKIEELSKENGKIVVIGRIDAFFYKTAEDKKGFMARIFG
ncbi:MAG: YabP/YqfC family sporulation protein [Clostridia bacterium]|nr:YabP/YqfC family sporulation protein [Clostridia bacterium]